MTTVLLQYGHTVERIAYMANKAKAEETRASEARVSAVGDPFVPGTMVVASLSNPREKFWGMLLGLSAAGVAVRGIDLNSFDDFVSLVRAGEPAGVSEVFFPMHRLDRLETDARNGEIPSLAERVEAATGHSAAALWRRTEAACR
ncbi:MAG: hypothetical protein ACE14L_03935 [Terriglobales bacterium]